MNKHPISINGKRAYRRMRNNDMSNRPIRVKGDLSIMNDASLVYLNKNLRYIDSLNLVGCVNLPALPDLLEVEHLNVSGCTSLTALPENLHVRRLSARGSGLEIIPESIVVAEELDLRDCIKLTELPDNLEVPSLRLAGCTALESLPDGLRVSYLDIADCTSLQSWGERGELTHVNLSQPSRFGNSSQVQFYEARSINMRGCVQLRDLPTWLRVVRRLNVNNCLNLTQIPRQLRIVDSLELAESGLTHLPKGARHSMIFWNGVAIDEKIAFRPDKITAREVLSQSNTEVRRVMLERMGYRRFFDQLDPRLIDLDQDAGGERMLLSVNPFDRWWEEPIVCLSVSCPSTQHQYMLRVPPFVTSCHQAAAWLAGFDDPSLYKPLVEA